MFTTGSQCSGWMFRSMWLPLLLAAIGGTSVLGQSLPILPESADSSLYWKVCTLETPRLQQIPLLHGPWESSYPYRRDSVWSWRCEIAEYERSANAWNVTLAAWSARRKQVELLIEVESFEKAMRVIDSWPLASDHDAQRAALGIAYTFARFGGVHHKDRLLKKLMNYDESRSRANEMLPRLNENPPPRARTRLSLRARVNEEFAANQRKESKVNLITQMIDAAFEGDANKLQSLLRSGISADVVGRETATPLLVVSALGHTDALMALLESGADPNQRFLGRERRGSTPLIFAIGPGHVEIIRLLIGNGADVNVAGGEGESPLMFAAAQKKVEIVRELLKAGADVNAIVIGDSAGEYDQYSALMVAAQNGHDEIVKTLLEAGANTKLQNADGETARELAQKAGHVDVANRIAGSE